MTGIGIGAGFGVVGAGSSQTGFSLTTSVEMNGEGQANEHADFGTYSAIQFDFNTDPFTMGVWVKTSITADDQVLMVIHEDSTHTYEYYALQYHGATGYLRFHRGNVSLGDFYVAVSENIADGIWHFVAVTVTSGGIRTIYVDGVPGTVVGSGGDFPVVNPTGKLWVGSLETVTPFTVREFQGRMCHSFVYDTDLSAAQILELYGGGVPQDLNVVGLTTNLVHWCTLGDGCAIGTGNMVDLSPIGNNGTYVSGESEDFVLDVPPNGYVPLTTSIEMNNGSSDESADFPSPLTIPDTGQAFTMGCWFKTSSTNQVVVMAKQYSGVGDYSWGIALGGSALYACRTSGVANWAYRRNTGFDYRNGNWYFVAMVHDGVAWTNIALYVGGQGWRPIVGTGSVAIGGPDTNGILVVGGSRNLTSLNWPLDGRVCHEFLYNKALSAAELSAIYGGGVPQNLSTVGPTGNLVHWCALGDGDAIGSGNLIDLSTGGNDGTYINGDSGDFVLDTPP